MFEKATRVKLRYATTNGNLAVEDLWDLPLTSNTGRPNLDDIARNLSKKVKEAETESFVTKPAKADEADQLAFEIVKHVIKIRLAENEATLLEKTNKEKKQQLLRLIADKENDQLAGKSLEELKAMVESM